MGRAKTQKGAARRVAMKRAIRRSGHPVSSSATNKELEKKYRQYTGKTPPAY